jgi:hypothetical protein
MLNLRICGNFVLFSVILTPRLQVFNQTIKKEVICGNLNCAYITSVDIRSNFPQK